MFRPAFDQMDFDKKGYVSKEEYMKLNAWRCGEEQALAAFKLMDSDNDGLVREHFHFVLCSISH